MLKVEPGGSIFNADCRGILSSLWCGIVCLTSLVCHCFWHSPLPELTADLQPHRYFPRRSDCSLLAEFPGGLCRSTRPSEALPARGTWSHSGYQAPRFLMPLRSPSNHPHPFLAKCRVKPKALPDERLQVRQYKLRGNGKCLKKAVSGQ